MIIRQTNLRRINETLRKMRKAKSIMQVDMAKALNCARATIVNIEKGYQRATLPKIIEFAAACGYDTEIVFRERK